MVVIKVDSVVVDWQKIGHTLAEVLQTEEDFQFYPFDNTQAILAVESIEERDVLCGGNHPSLTDAGICLRPWTPEVNIIQSTPKFEGWIVLVGLPFFLWSTEVFTSIANKMGGLQSIDPNSRGFVDLSMARIQVNGSMCSIPARIEVYDAGVCYPVDIRLVPPPEPSKKGSVIITIPAGGDHTPVEDSDDGEDSPEVQMASPVA